MRNPFQSEKKPFKDKVYQIHHTVEVQDRRDFLATVKKVLVNFTNNINHGRNDSEPIKLLDYVRNKVVNLMLIADANLKKSADTRNRLLLYSSESESESGSNASKVDTFNKCVDEYLGIDEKRSSWHKALLQAKGYT